MFKLTKQPAFRDRIDPLSPLNLIEGMTSFWIPQCLPS